MSDEKPLSSVVPNAETQPLRSVNSFYAMREWKKNENEKEKDSKDEKKDEKEPVKQMQTFFALHNPKVTKKTAPKFILSYFGYRGRAELSRILLVEAQIPYEDYRMPNDAKKDLYPFCQLPSFEKLGSKLKISESSAIERYIARIGGLYGESDDEAAHIDMFYEFLKSTILPFLSVIWKKDSDDKKAETKSFFENLPSWNKLLTTGLTSDPHKPSISPFSMDKIFTTLSSPIFLVGRKVSLADIAFYRGFSEIITLNENIFKDFPYLQALYERIRDRPNIAKWVKERPVSAW